MDRIMIGSIEATRDAVGNILSAFGYMFGFVTGNLKELVTRIVGTPYLLISLALLICGFTIGVLKRLINL